MLVRTHFLCISALSSAALVRIVQTTHFRFLFGIYLDTVFRPPNLLLAIHIMDDI